jgi:hypothetical protein
MNVIVMPRRLRDRLGVRHWGTIEALGPFGKLARGGSFVLLSAFIAVITVALRTEERQRTHARLSDAQPGRDAGY